MKTRIIALIIATVGLASILLTYPFLFAQTTNFTLPTRSGTCLGKGASFTMPLTVNELTNVLAWQVNVTYTPVSVNLTSFTLRSSFTGSNVWTASVNRTGTVIIGFTYEKGATITTTSTTTLVTFTFKTLVKNAAASFHIVLSSEDSSSGTMLLGPMPTDTQTYTTTDGSLSCGLSPGP